MCACTVYIHCYCDCTVHCTMKMSWLLLPLCLSVERSQQLHGASVYHNIISDFVSKCSVCRVCCALSIGSQVETCRPPWQWSVIMYRCVSDYRWGYDDDRGHLRDTDRHKIEWGEREERSSSIMRRWGDEFLINSVLKTICDLGSLVFTDRKICPDSGISISMIKFEHS